MPFWSMAQYLTISIGYIPTREIPKVFFITHLLRNQSRNSTPFEVVLLDPAVFCLKEDEILIKNNFFVYSSDSHRPTHRPFLYINIQKKMFLKQVFSETTLIFDNKTLIFDKSIIYN